MDLAGKAFDEHFPKLIDDAGAYMVSRLSTEVLNGVQGENYPKPYPGGITEGATGFVGTITSNLRRSMGKETVEKFEVRISQINNTMAVYHDDIITWSKEKYGKNFYEIAVELYGPAIAKEMLVFSQRIMKEADNLKKFTYKNPFPG